MLLIQIFSISSSLTASSTIILEVDDVVIVDDGSVVGGVRIVGDVVDLAAFQFSLSWDPSVFSTDISELFICIFPKFT